MNQILSQLFYHLPALIMIIILLFFYIKKKISALLWLLITYILSYTLAMIVALDKGYLKNISFFHGDEDLLSRTIGGIDYSLSIFFIIGMVVLLQKYPANRKFEHTKTSI